jgi:hypothetical protein
MAIYSLNNFNGVNGATTFTDENGNVTWSQIGGHNASLTTAFKQFGASSVYGNYDGSSNAEIETNDIGIDRTGDWTAECWLAYQQSGGTSGEPSININDNVGNLFAQIELYKGTWYFDILDADSNVITTNSGSGLSASTFYHCALVHDAAAGEFSAFLNGSRIGNISTSTEIGALDRISFFFDGDAAGYGGWADSVRVTNEVKYSGATYTVPTEEFSGDETVSATRATISISGYAASFIISTTIHATRASIAISGYAASIYDPVQATRATISLIGLDATIISVSRFIPRPFAVPLMVLPQVRGTDWKREGQQLVSALALGMEDIVNSTLRFAYGIYPTSTRMAFGGAAAPTGWQLDSSAMDRVLRSVAGTGGDVGGSWTVGLYVKSAALGIGQIPSHVHAALMEEHSHTHGFSEEAAGAHEHSGTSNADIGHGHVAELVLGGGHTHSFTIYNFVSGASLPQVGQFAGTTLTSSAAGAHTHASVSVVASTHSHFLETPIFSHSHTVTMAPDGSHAHEALLDYAGSDSQHAHSFSADGSWRPAYIDVVLCTKLPITS